MGGPAPSEAAACLQSSRMSWAEARDPSMYRPIAIALLMRFLQQLTGITPVLVYLQSIFHSTAVLLVSAPAPALLEAPAALRAGLHLAQLCAPYLVHVQGRRPGARTRVPCHAAVLRVMFASKPDAL